MRQPEAVYGSLVSANKTPPILVRSSLLRLNSTFCRSSVKRGSRSRNSWISVMGADVESLPLNPRVDHTNQCPRVHLVRSHIVRGNHDRSSIAQQMPAIQLTGNIFQRFRICGLYPIAESRVLAATDFPVMEDDG